MRSAGTDASERRDLLRPLLLALAAPSEQQLLLEVLPLGGVERAQELRVLGPCRHILPADAAEVHQTQKRLVDERGRLQRVILPFPAHLEPGEPAEFLMDDGQEFIKRGAIAIAPGEEEIGDLGTRSLRRLRAARHGRPESTTAHVE